MRSRRESHEYRAERDGVFKKLGNGKFGGYRKGVVNGPEARRPARSSKASGKKE